MTVLPPKMQKAVASAMRLEDTGPKGKPIHPQPPWMFDTAAVSRGLATVIGSDGKPIGTFKTFGAALHAIQCVNLLVDADVDLLRIGLYESTPLRNALSIAVRTMSAEQSKSKWTSSADKAALELLNALAKGDYTQLQEMIDLAAGAPPPVRSNLDVTDLEVQKIRSLIAEPSNRNFEIAYDRLEYITEPIIRRSLDGEIQAAKQAWAKSIQADLIDELEGTDGPVSVARAAPRQWFWAKLATNGVEHLWYYDPKFPDKPWISGCGLQKQLSTARYPRIDGFPNPCKICQNQESSRANVIDFVPSGPPEADGFVRPAPAPSEIESDPLDTPMNRDQAIIELRKYGTLKKSKAGVKFTLSGYDEMHLLDDGELIALARLAQRSGKNPLDVIHKALIETAVRPTVAATIKEMQTDDDGMVTPPEKGVYFWASKKKDEVAHAWVRNGADTAYVTDCGKKAQFAPTFAPNTERCDECARGERQRQGLAATIAPDTHAQQLAYDLLSDELKRFFLNPACPYVLHFAELDSDMTSMLFMISHVKTPKQTMAYTEEALETLLDARDNEEAAA